MYNNIDELHTGDHEIYLELLGAREETNQGFKPVSLSHLLNNLHFIIFNKQKYQNWETFFMKWHQNGVEI